MLEQWQKQHAFLQQVNPTLKIGAVLFVIGIMIPIFDPWTPLILWAVTVALICILGHISLRKLLVIMLPFFFFAFSFLWMSVVFPAERGEIVLFEMGPLVVAQENVATGISLGMRALVFASWSLLFVLTTEPTRFMLSLIQHCKLPPRFGYGMMAAYRFLPLFQQELQQIRAAHRIRGLGESHGIRGRWEQLKRYTIPLMASAIRKAERVAVAMESKGFDGSRSRTYYRHIPWTSKDAWFTGIVVTVMVSIMVARHIWLV